jgi:hypothetical protein
MCGGAIVYPDPRHQAKLFIDYRPTAVWMLGADVIALSSMRDAATRTGSIRPAPRMARTTSARRDHRLRRGEPAHRIRATLTVSLFARVNNLFDHHHHQAQLGERYVNLQGGKEAEEVATTFFAPGAPRSAGSACASTSSRKGRRAPSSIATERTADRPPARCRQCALAGIGIGCGSAAVTVSASVVRRPRLRARETPGPKREWCPALPSVVRVASCRWRGRARRSGTEPEPEQQEGQTNMATTKIGKSGGQSKRLRRRVRKTDEFTAVPTKSVIDQTGRRPPSTIRGSRRRRAPQYDSGERICRWRPIGKLVPAYRPGVAAATATGTDTTSTTGATYNAQDIIRFSKSGDYTALGGDFSTNIETLQFASGSKVRLSAELFENIGT